MKTRSKEEIEWDIQVAVIGLRTRGDNKSLRATLRRLCKS